MSDDGTSNAGIDEDAEGHGFIPDSVREHELDDAEGHTVNYRPLEKDRPV